MKEPNKQEGKPWWEEKFIEEGARIEHERWAKWQNYLHSFLEWNNDLKAWVLPHEKKDRWQRQVNTPYSMLSEQEKESDRKEVRTYLPMIRKVVESAEKQATEEAMRKCVEIARSKKVADDTQMSDDRIYDEACEDIASSLEALIK